MRHVFTTMGTTVSLETPQPTVTAAIERVFIEYDERFSLYRPDSELSRIAKGDLRLAASSRWIRETYAEALACRESTRGAFTPHRPDGTVDLNGIVKAQAMRDAGRILAATVERWCLNVGGDVLVGGNTDDPAWSVGIVDPADRATLLLAVDLLGTRRAVATSGIAERGDHVWRGGSRTSPEFVQASVIADDIVTADVLATAIIAGGQATLDEVTDRWDVDVLAVSATGELAVTPGFRTVLSH
jgi:thiamine biosynthesis lipoprotein